MAAKPKPMPARGNGEEIEIPRPSRRIAKRKRRSAHGLNMKQVLAELTVIEQDCRSAGAVGHAINALRAITDIYARCASEVTDAGKGLTDEEKVRRVKEIFGIDDSDTVPAGGHQ